MWHSYIARSQSSHLKEYVLSLGASTNLTCVAHLVTAATDNGSRTLSVRPPFAIVMQEAESRQTKHFTALSWPSLDRPVLASRATLVPPTVLPMLDGSVRAQCISKSVNGMVYVSHVVQWTPTSTLHLSSISNSNKATRVSRVLSKVCHLVPLVHELSLCYTPYWSYLVCFLVCVSMLAIVKRVRTCTDVEAHWSHRLGQS